MSTVLIVEDDSNTRLITERYVSREYSTITAKNGREGLEIMEKQRVDFVLTDIMMPVMDGYEMAKRIREEGKDTPVIFMTALQSTRDKIEGFELGCDDYIVKPVDYTELLWRIKALLRRSNMSGSRKLKIGEIEMDSVSYTLKRGDESVELTKKEFELLFKLLSSPNRIFTKNQLMNEIWGDSVMSGEDTVKVHLSRIRNKTQSMTEFEIVAVKGIGYKAVTKEK